MRVLVIGGGGREHVICRTLLKSPRISRLYCAPGNAGIAQTAVCVDISATDIKAIIGFVKAESIDYVVVAPDNPLALGMVDALEAEGIRCFGPRKDAAIIESSKVFSKNLMYKYGIPTAGYAVFSEAEDAKAYIRLHGAPIVVKADGLALGKGVVVAMDEAAALGAVDAIMMERKFGDSGSSVVIEEYMTGPEVTVLAFTDGHSIVPMLSSQDHKRVFTGDLGPNTGGMGAFSPSPLYTPEIAAACMDTIFRPTVDAMRSEGRPFKGVIYFGLMLTANGPRVIEYNARFGDPEAQAVLSLLNTDLLDIFEAVTDERLADVRIDWLDGSACCVVMASHGYPGEFEKGFKISGLGDMTEGLFVYHAGTKLVDGDIVTNGGRVLGVTAVADTLKNASALAYTGVSKISFQNAHFRTDIGTMV